MRRTAIVAGLFSCGFIFLGSAPSTVHAETVEPPVFVTSTSSSDELAVLQLMDQRAEAAAQPPAPAPVQPVVHTVQNGESLASIANQHKTTWQRLFAKNTAIADPDIISAGSHLTVPTADEQLTERPVPLKAAPTAPAPAEAPKTTATRLSAPRSVSRRGSSSGNTYTYGYCTWYVKNRRPDLPNNLGNADTWVSRAAAQGIPTGSVPRAGAVGQRGMHVVYVERVNSDGTIFISEMNREGWNVTSTRTVPASYFSYIY